MDNNEFWWLIDKAKEKSKGNRTLQEQLLISSLTECLLDEIVEFECILREYLIEADDFKIIAAQKIIDGYVIDDPYLYFRCWLIGQGREVFMSALHDPDTLADVMDEPYQDFEELLYVATAAYEQRTGKKENDDKEDVFPRGVASARGLDYDFGSFTKGDDWTEEQLPTMFPRLWAKFNT
ncbi:DUF4240 domain-containing protein [Hymenobacter sp. YC55]|uniref:DUF4240 domain-containing protein n=1 Tax=Hymenobacter sp. YC55 TaxID=3034019 RepID=UPI0023F6EBCB|nr:DUF4240 domain-containing protein [Hymenobacter sp. YC55]MDF7812841.1 DUF4240 domain-containing protein [Hymenobacter sp. YC55]